MHLQSALQREITTSSTFIIKSGTTKSYREPWYSTLRAVTTIVIAHTYCASQDTRYSDFLSAVLINTGIFLRGSKLCGESRT